mgnify:CR=1 FL=1
MSNKNTYRDSLGGAKNEEHTISQKYLEAKHDFIELENIVPSSKAHLTARGSGDDT